MEHIVRGQAAVAHRLARGVRMNSTASKARAPAAWMILFAARGVTAGRQERLDRSSSQRWRGRCWTPSGMKSSRKVLAFFPNTERKSAAVAALRAIIEARQAQGSVTGALEAMLRELESRP